MYTCTLTTVMLHPYYCTLKHERSFHSWVVASVHEEENYTKELMNMWISLYSSDSLIHLPLPPPLPNSSSSSFFSFLILILFSFHSFSFSLNTPHSPYSTYSHLTLLTLPLTQNNPSLHTPRHSLFPYATHAALHTHLHGQYVP